MISTNGVAYHNTCFRCNHCNGRLALSTYSTLDGVLYCKPHFEQIYKEKGGAPLKHSASLGRQNELLSTYSTLDGVLYCKPHFEQIYKEKGGAPLKHSASLGRQNELNRSSSKVSALFSGTQDKCAACKKTVYPLEKVTVDGEMYHKICFRCVHGGCKLTTSSYAAFDGRLYCKPHFSQLFKEKGSYNHLSKNASMKKDESLINVEQEGSSTTSAAEETQDDKS
uniref:Pollen-specific protein SF3 n=1 Tax=Solanum tuberosum TaxID=4113 RepID=M0ZTR1_SOLTU